MSAVQNQAMNGRFPTLFVSHGAPDILLSEGKNAESLRALPSLLPRPRGIVIVSAHWIDDPVGITSSEHLTTTHDFGGFQPQLYQQHYPARGDAALSQRVAGLLSEQNVSTHLHTSRGLDHGAWIPLMMMYPQADIPVVQLSLPAGGLAQLAKIGEALAPLRKEGVLIMGSGGSVHNLRMLNPAAQTEAWVEQFEEWLRQSIEGNHFDELLLNVKVPEHFSLAHPTIEHYAPIVLAWAAGSTDRPGRRVHHGYSYGNLGMSHYMFGE